MKNSIKREQSQACLNFAERKNFRLQAKYKILMTLALLITAATGAWAEDLSETIRTTTQNKYTYTGEHFKIECGVSTGDGCWLGYVGNYRVTITPLADEKITKVEMVVGKVSGTIVSSTGTISGSNSVGSTLTLNDVDATTITLSRSGGGSYEYAALKSFTIYYEIPLATLAADGLSATFTMPASDVTADYELVRDMSVQMTAQVGDATEDTPRYRVKKVEQGEGYEPAELEPAEVMGLISVYDQLEQKSLTPQQDFYVKIFKIDEQTFEPISTDGVEFADFDFAPGLYAVKAIGQDESEYDGETALSNTFKLFQGFPVVVPATEGEVGETVDLGTVSFYTNEFNLKLDPANQAKLYTLTAIDGSTVTATQVDVVPAGMPFFVLNEDDVEQMVTLIPADDNELPTTSPLVIAEFLGATEDLTFTQADMDGAYNYYVLYKGAFVWVKDPGTLKAGKCYLRVPKNQPTTARRIVFGDATAVYDLNDKSEMINDNYYDLNGRKVNAPKKKGVYIQNGRKVVVK